MLKNRNRKPQFIHIHITFPSREMALGLARVLVKERLVACAQIFKGITSVYQWDGKIEEQTEVLLALKTVHDKYALIEEKVVASHPYETPEVVSFQLDDGSKKYYEWIETHVQDEHQY